MKNYEITFKNGLLIDKKTGKVINLAPFNTYHIQGDDDAFLVEDNKQIKDMPLSSEEKIAKLKKQHKGFLIEKIKSKGDAFYYRIGLGKPKEEDIVREYLFNAVLEEDLYIKSKTGEKWTLCKCKCQTNQLIEGNLGLEFQPIEANSLSELFANVVSTYFNKKRSTACNAFKTFHSLTQDEVPSLDWIKSKKNTLISVIRKAKVLKLKMNYLKI